MRMTLLTSAAAGAIALLAAPAIAEDPMSSIDLSPEGSVSVGVSTTIEAEDIMKGSEAEEWVIDAVVTTEDGSVLGTITSCTYDDEDRLETLVIKASDGEHYDLPAEKVEFDASAGTVTTTATFAELELHRNPLERAGDVIEDFVDGDTGAEDLGPDHVPDENDVDDPEFDAENPDL